MSLIITLTRVTNVEGRPIKAPVLDEDGQPKWKVRPDPDARVAGEQELKDADQCDLYRTLAINIPRQVASPNDGLRVLQLLNAIDRADGQALTLKEKVYEWTRHLLNREVPTYKDPQTGIQYPAQPYSMALWGYANHAWIMEQLRHDGERRGIEQMMDLE